jgi:virginiamycin B lyase
MRVRFIRWLARAVRAALVTAACCVALHANAATGASRASDTERSRSVELAVGGAIPFDARASRAPLWTFDALPEISTHADAEPVVFGDGAVFVGERYGAPMVIAAIDEPSGKPRWSSDLFGAPAALAGNTLLALVQQPNRQPVQPGGQRVAALDSRTGRVRWSIPGTGVALVRQLAIVNNGQHLEARAARTGTLRWTSRWNGYPPREVRLIGTTLLLDTVESGAIMVGVLYAYDIRDGRALWVAGDVNRIIGGAAEKTIVVDDTWGPHALSGLGPLSVKTFALPDGAASNSRDFAPDLDRSNAATDFSTHFAQDAAADGDAVIFRIGPTTVYRYAQAGTGSAAPPARYELGPLTRAGDDTWLVRLPDGGAGIAHLDPAHASLARLSGLDGVEFTGVYDGLALVAARGRAAVFDPARPADAVVSDLPCTTVTRAFGGAGAIVAVCSEPVPRLVALAAPSVAPALAAATPVPIRTQQVRAFAATVAAYELPTKFIMTRGAAFAADGTLWFCEHAVFNGGVAGHTDFIGRLNPSGTIDEFPVPTNDANVVSIARGPDGALWFTEASAVKVGLIAADGSITEYALPAELHRDPVFPFRGQPLPTPAPTATRAPRPLGRRRTFEKLGGIAAGPDGALWITAPFAHAVARVTTTGDVHVFTLPPNLLYPGNIARGPDAALWIAARDAIVRLAPAGDVRAYPLDTSRGLTSLVWGPDGNLWFSFFDGRAGRITPHGAVRIFPGPVVGPPSGPLVGGCDGALYVADRLRPTLWRLTTNGNFIAHDLPYAIQSFARAPDCTLGVTEAQAPAVGHVGTITLGH